MRKDRDFDANQVLDALGERTRRRIIAELRDADQSVSSLAGPLGITVTAVSQHLAVLEAAKLIKTAKVGRTRTCTLDPRGFAALEHWVLDWKSQWEGRLDKLTALLDEEEPEA